MCVCLSARVTLRAVFFLRWIVGLNLVGGKKKDNIVKMSSVQFHGKTYLFVLLLVLTVPQSNSYSSSLHCSPTPEHSTHSGWAS